jgi:hypothetical protein
MLEAQLQNPYNTSSILTNTINTAPNGKPYDFTWDEKELAGNPHLILAKDNPSGAPTLQFTPEQEKAALERLRLEARMRYDKKVEIKATPQAQLQESRPRSAAEMDRADAKVTAKNVAQNLVYSLTGNSNESTAGTQYLSSSTGLPFTKTKEGYVVVDENGNKQTFKFKADGKTLADPTKFTKSFVGTISRKMGIREDDVLEEFGKLLPKGAKINLTTEAKGFEEQATELKDISAQITPDLFTIKSEKSAGNLNSILPSGFKAEDIGGVFGNDVKVTAANGKTYVYNANVGSEQAEKQKASLAEFIKINSGGKSGTGGTGELD